MNALGRARARLPALLPALPVSLLMGLLVASAPTAVRAAGGPSIADVDDAPASYLAAPITLTGTVDPGAVVYGDESLYTLRADGRAIAVLGLAPAPAAGAQLAVTGQLTLRPPDEEFTFPPLLLETARTPAP